MAALGATVAFAGRARAQPTMPGYGAPPIVPEYAHEVTTPNVPLIAGGGLAFAAAYVASVTAAASSLADPRLFIPVAGPWLALERSCIDRAQCASSPVSRGVLAGDGIAQLAGLAVLTAGVLEPHRRWVLGRADAPVRVEVAPTPVAGGLGVAAVGTF